MTQLIQFDYVKNITDDINHTGVVKSHIGTIEENRGDGYLIKLFNNNGLGVDNGEKPQYRYLKNAKIIRQIVLN